MATDSGDGSPRRSTSTQPPGAGRATGAGSTSMPSADPDGRGGLDVDGSGLADAAGPSLDPQPAVDDRAESGAVGATAGVSASSTSPAAAGAASPCVPVGQHAVGLGARHVPVARDRSGGPGARGPRRGRRAAAGRAGCLKPPRPRAERRLRALGCEPVLGLGR